MPWVKTRKPKDVADEFIELYTSYLKGLTDAPEEFHEPVALFLLASALDRKLFMRFKQGFRHPNVWVMILGESTLSRKSTCHNIARSIMIEVSRKTNLKQLADDSTPEGLIDSLSLEPRGHWMRDEVSGFFSLLKKDYMAGMKELLILIFDCIEHYEKHTVKSHYTLDKIYTNFLAGTTPKAFQDKISSEDFYTGFLARWLVFDGTFDISKWRGLEEYTDEDMATRTIIVNTLVYIHNLFTKIAQARFEPTTLEYYNSWSKANQLELLERDDKSDVAPFYGRLEEYAIKISMLYEVSNVYRLQQQLETHREYITVHKDSLTKAIRFVEFYKRDRLPQLMAKAYENKAAKILQIIEEAGDKGIQHSRLLRKSHITAKALRECIQTLDESDRITIKETKEGKKRKKTYSVVSDIVDI